MNKLKVKSKYLVLGLLMVLLGSYSAVANNIQVSNVSIASQNSSTHTYMVKFDLSWDNSWRINGGIGNWDAAWVFIKYRIKNQNTWHHARLSYVDGNGASDGHVVPSGATMSSSYYYGYSNGAFVYSSNAKPQGTATYNNIQLKWRYGLNSLTDGDRVEISVVAIEMVYIPQGFFQLGTGGGELGSFYKGSNNTSTYSVYSESSITVGTSAGNLNYTNSSSNTYGDNAGPIPADYPKGYNAMYCMKYEISQQQYVDFLNQLNQSQLAARHDNSNYGNRTLISGGTGNKSSTNPYVACGYLSVSDVLAYLDWAALRPMTELEYEKICRGTSSPTPGEYAWGSNSHTNSSYSLVNSGLTNEGIGSNYRTNVGNCMYSSTKGSINGPLRCGIFAANALNNGRETSGATFYGVMEMTGNVWEYVVSCGTSSSRQYNGRHGDGVLNSSGTANIYTLSSSSYGYRGGSYNSGQTTAQLSRRSYSCQTVSATARSAEHGGRGVRTAP